MKKNSGLKSVVAGLLVSSWTIAHAEVNNTLGDSINQEICLKLASAATGTSETISVSYTNVYKGRFLFFGEACYGFVYNGITVADCNPVHGSGIIRNNSIQISLLETSDSVALGVEDFARETFHLMLSTDTLSGTFASETVAYVNHTSTPVQLFSNGTVTRTACSTE